MHILDSDECKQAAIVRDYLNKACQAMHSLDCASSDAARLRILSVADGVTQSALTRIGQLRHQVAGRLCVPVVEDPFSLAFGSSGLECGCDDPDKCRHRRKR